MTYAGFHRRTSLRIVRFAVLLLIIAFAVVLPCIADPAAVTLSPTSLNFGQQTVGTTSSASAVTVTNHLSGPLDITAISTTGDFAQTNNCGNSLASGATCVIRVTFSPISSGTRIGTLSVADNAGSQSTALGGSGSVVGLASIVVTPSNQSIPLGLTQQFTATGYFKNGTVSDLTTAVTWASSNPGVFTFNNVGRPGVATSVGQGSGTVSASIGSIAGTTALTVAPPALVSVTLNPLNPSIAMGSRQQFTLTGSFTDHSVLPLTKGVLWQSSIPSVASLDQTGLAVAQNSGSTTISAQFSSFSASTNLTVASPSLVGIIVSPTNPTVVAGTTQQFTATGIFSDHSTQLLTSGVTWTSNSPSVATINAAGVASAIAQGQTTIVSASVGTVSGSTTLLVGPPALVSLSLSPSNPSVPAGTIQQFQAIGTFSDNSTQPVFSQGWTSSNTSVATINLAGNATSIAQGSTTITLTAFDGLQSVTGTTILTVTPPVFKSLAIVPAHQALLPGATQQLQVQEVYTDGSTSNVPGSVTWASSNTAVASVTSAGLMTTASQGVAVISAVSSDLNLTATTPVEVSATGQARFAYVTNYRDDTVSLYMVDGTNGQLFPAEDKFLGGGNGPVALASRPLGEFLYTANKDSASVSEFSIDPISGVLTLISNTQTVIGPFSLAVHPSGQYLFVSGAQLLVYSIASNGTLGLTQQVINNPIFVTADISGTLVYAAQSFPGGIYGYSFDASRGLLTPIDGSPFSAGLNPQSVIVHPSGKFAYVANGNGQSVSMFSVDPTTGALIGQGEVAVQQIPTFLAFDRSGNFLYVTNQSSNSISAFAVDAITGNLTALPGSPFTTIGGDGPSWISVDPTNHFLYVANQGTNTIGILGISADGELTFSNSVPTGTKPLSMTLVK